MLEDLAEILKPREEPFKFGKVALVVRELDGTADLAVLSDPEDRQWRILVRSVFRADSGERAFDDADIPALKRKSPAVTGELMRAVMRVNGTLPEEEEKNSAAVPA